MTKKTLSLPGVGVLLVFLLGFLALIFWPGQQTGAVQEITSMWKWEAHKDRSTGAWQRLPDYWNKRGLGGTWKYLGSFKLTPAQIHSDDPLVIYVPRAGNRFSIDINGNNIAQMGKFAADQSDYSHQAHIFPLPKTKLYPGSNQIAITVQGERLRAAGLPILQIGPAKVLPTDRLSPLLFSPPMTLGIVLLAFTMSCFFGLLFLQNRSALYLFVTLTCASGCTHLSTLLIASPPLDYHWWTLVFEASILSFIVSLSYFAYTALELNKCWLNRLTIAFLLCALFLIPAIAFLRSYDAWKTWTTLALLYGWFITLKLCYTWLYRRDKISTAVALAAVFGCVLGTIDHFNLFFTFSGFYKAYFLRFVLLGFLLAVGFIMVELSTRERLAAETARLRAQHQYEQEKRMLQEQFAVQSNHIQDTVQKQERVRFMQNLHDGMGIQLQGLLALAENNESNKNSRLIQEVRATIDQMRMAVDSMQTFDGSILELLGQIRYRIEARMDLIGTSITWKSSIESDVPVTPPAPLAGTNLQQILYELTVNVIKHSKASLVHIHIRLNAQELGIDFIDNGIGFHSTSPSRNGIGTQSIHRRVEELGGKVQWKTRAQGGTRCELHFPLQNLYTPPTPSGLLS